MNIAEHLAAKDPVTRFLPVYIFQVVRNRTPSLPSVCSVCKLPAFSEHVSHTVITLRPCTQVFTNSDHEGVTFTTLTGATKLIRGSEQGHSLTQSLGPEVLNQAIK